MWVGHSLRLRSGQALSDAFEVVLARVCVVLFARGSPVVMTGRITSQNLKSKSKASDRACPERSRRDVRAAPSHWHSTGWQKLIN